MEVIFIKGKVEYLTNKEYGVMKTLWASDKPLTSSQILELSTDRNWSDRSMYSLINNLIKKKFVEVTGKVKATKTNARLFSPTISAEEYASIQLNEVFEDSGNKASISSLLSYFNKHQNDNEDLLLEIEEWLGKESDN